jgi:hypothetical protein
MCTALDTQQFGITFEKHTLQYRVSYTDTANNLLVDKGD